MTTKIAKLDALADYAASVVARAKPDLVATYGRPPIEVRRQEGLSRRGEPYYQVEVLVGLRRGNMETNFPVLRGVFTSGTLTIEIGREVGRVIGYGHPSRKPPSRAMVREAVLEQIDPFVPRSGPHVDPREVAAFVSTRSYMSLNAESLRAAQSHQPNTLSFSTRDNGSVGDEQPGREDVAHAIEVKRALRKQYSRRVRATVDTVDEWTNLEIEV